MDLGEGQRPHTARKLLLGWAREIAMERGQHRDGNSESLLDLRRRVQEGKTKLLRASHGLAGRVGDSQRASPTLARRTAESLLPAGPRMRAECAGKHADGGRPGSLNRTELLQRWAGRLSIPTIVVVWADLGKG